MSRNQTLSHRRARRTATLPLAMAALGATALWLLDPSVAQGGQPPMPPQPETETAEPAREGDAAREAGEEAAEAARTYRAVMGQPETAIPSDVLERAQAVGVFPNVIEAALFVGGHGGNGLISRRTADGWSAPAFYNLGGASIGAQLGGRSTDIVLIFTTAEAVDALLDERVTFGAEVRAVAGTAEADAAASVRTDDQADVLVYTRDAGLFAGASLDGGIVTADDDANRATYGATAREIFSGDVTETPDEVRVFQDALEGTPEHSSAY